MLEKKNRSTETHNAKNAIHYQTIAYGPGENEKIDEYGLDLPDGIVVYFEKKKKIHAIIFCISNCIQIRQYLFTFTVAIGSC